MSLLFTSFWRAASYCFLPRVIVGSFLPLVLMMAVVVGLGYVYWEPSVAYVTQWMQSTDLTQSVLNWMDSVGWSGLSSVVAPLIIIFAFTPLVVVATLLLVAGFMTPAMVGLVVDRRFSHLIKRGSSHFWGSIVWSVSSTLLAIVMLVVSIPLWFIPPLILLVPLLIWGWLTYRVFAYDALSEHASAHERQTIFQRHRFNLLTMGVVSGYLGAAPSLLWASGAIFIVMAPVLVPLAIWIYTLVLAFSSLWFAHYCLAVLDNMRQTSPDRVSATALQLDAEDLQDLRDTNRL